MENPRIQKILNGQSLPAEISKNIEHDTESYANNCENVIGSIQVPTGIAGPLTVNGKQYILPLATTEAALVASINRGCKAITMAGGAKAVVRKIGITRAPVYKIKNIKSLQFYKNWFTANKDHLQSIISENSRFTKILKIVPKKYKGLLFVKFFFDTGDAMGMNMATIACQAMNTFICSELKADCLALSSNFCSDKKPSQVNIEEGRGSFCRAWVEFSNEEFEDIFKVSVKRLYETYKAKIVMGSRLAKSLARNSHQANIIAAMFMATGQDLAHVAEGSLGQTIVRKNPAKIRFEVVVPNLICGTVGGGTKLITQNEALNLIGLNPGDDLTAGSRAIELAEVISAAILAGEISLLASIAEGSLAKVHDQFRGVKK